MWSFVTALALFLFLLSPLAPSEGEVRKEKVSAALPDNIDRQGELNNACELKEREKRGGIE